MRDLWYYRLVILKLRLNAHLIMFIKKYFWINMNTRAILPLTNILYKHNCYSVNINTLMTWPYVYKKIVSIDTYTYIQFYS